MTNNSRIRTSAKPGLIPTALRSTNDQGATDAMPSGLNDDSSQRSYPIAWVTTRTSEHVASVSMLDEIHAQPAGEYSTKDNRYTLGSVAKCDVVVALLSHDSSSGIVIAAAQLIKRFPDVRVMLMVGIGGAVPSSNIRLGDVVVGNAVFRRNKGVAPGGQRLDSPALSQPIRPPPIVRAAIKTLDVEAYATKGYKIDEVVHKLLKSCPDLKRFTPPLPESDRLFRTHVVHPKDKAHCDTFCANEKENEIPRSERSSNSTKVHRGTIICTDEPTEKAELRDELADETDALCLETGIGSIIHFPCVVIRGLSDYADGHPTGRWSEYAAMTAAAYAKDLVTQLDPHQLEILERIKSDLGAKRLKFEDVRKPHRFFRPGRVFAMLWVEPRSNRQGGKQESPLQDQNSSFSKVRRFIVVYQSYHASWCVPIHTYGGQGVEKRDIRIQDHARVYTSDQEEPAKNGNLPLRDPVAIVTEGSGEARRLRKDSLVNFGKVYTVEYGAQVMNIGYVLRSHSARLELPRKKPCFDRENMVHVGTQADERTSPPYGIQVAKQKPTSDTNTMLCSNDLTTSLAGSTALGQAHGSGNGNFLSSRKRRRSSESGLLDHGYQPGSRPATKRR